MADNLEEQLDDQVFNISQIFIKYSDEFYTWTDQGCNGTVSDETLKVDYIGALDATGPFKLYSLYRTLIEHIQCKLKLNVYFEAYEKDYYQQETFILDPLPIENNIADYGYLVPFDETEMVTILTAMRDVRDQVYFSFAFLLDWEVWVFLFLNLIFVSYLISKSSRSKVAIHKAMLDIFRTLTGQTSNSAHLWLKLRQGKWKRKSSFIILQVLLYITVLTCTILTKSMSSVLLETYMSSYKKPIINSLKGIANNERLQVEGADLLSMFQNETDFEFWEKLSAKMQNNEALTTGETVRKARTMNDPSTIRAILNGELVLLDNSKNNRNKMNMFPSLPLAIGRRKYKRTLFAFFINKNATRALDVTRVIQKAIEAGFHQHLRLVDELNSFWKGKIIQGDMSLEDFVGLHIKNDVALDFTLETDEISRSILLFWFIGEAVAVTIFLYELAIFYFDQIYPSIDGFNMNDLHDYELAEAIKFETFSDEKFVLKFVRFNSNKTKNIHWKLQQNYDIYFSR